MASIWQKTKISGRKNDYPKEADITINFSGIKGKII